MCSAVAAAGIRNTGGSSSSATALSTPAQCIGDHRGPDGCGRVCVPSGFDVGSGDDGSLTGVSMTSVSVVQPVDVRGAVASGCEGTETSITEAESLA